jgi:hypothetical protein
MVATTRYIASIRTWLDFIFDCRRQSKRLNNAARYVEYKDDDDDDDNEIDEQQQPTTSNRRNATGNLPYRLCNCHYY